MRNVVTLFAAAFLLNGCCSKCNNEMTRYHEDGRAKPIVAIPSMVDTTSFELPWSLSEEITTNVVKNVAQGGAIFVNATDEFSPNENPFGQDLSWMKREFYNQEFAVFMELVEHELVPASKGKKSTVHPHEQATNLNMAIRLRVVDLRGPTPKIVLQEMVRDSYFIPRSLLPTDYNTIPWGNENYRNTPMGIAHNQLVQQIASRVSDYILLAKSR